MRLTRDGEIGVDEYEKVKYRKVIDFPEVATGYINKGDKCLTSFNL